MLKGKGLENKELNLVHVETWSFALIQMCQSSDVSKQFQSLGRKLRFSR
jgi:hypothetical protein